MSQRRILERVRVPRARRSDRKKRAQMQPNVSRRSGTWQSLSRQVSNHALAHLADEQASVAPQGIEDQLERQRGGGRPMDPSVKAEMENALGTKFEGVRIHSDVSANALARALDARAFTHGRDLYFAHGEYAPQTSEGQRILAHELTHVIQQSDREPINRVRWGSSDDHDGDKQARTPDNVERAAKHPSIRLEADHTVLRRAKDDRVIYSGGHSGKLTVVKGGKPIYTARAVSGHPDTGVNVKGAGPIPPNEYTLHPQTSANTITKWQQGHPWGAKAIASGHQRINTSGWRLCPVKSSAYCQWKKSRNPKKPKEPPRRRYLTRVESAWGNQRIKIEGSAKVGQVTRTGFYIHGGLRSLTATSGCIKVFGSKIFDSILQLNGGVTLEVGKPSTEAERG